MDDAELVRRNRDLIATAGEAIRSARQGIARAAAICVAVQRARLNRRNHAGADRFAPNLVRHSRPGRQRPSGGVIISAVALCGGNGCNIAQPAGDVIMANIASSNRERKSIL